MCGRRALGAQIQNHHLSMLGTVGISPLGLICSNSSPARQAHRPQDQPPASLETCVTGR
jgi:hypothetical protein